MESAEDTQFAHVSSDLEGVHTCADCGGQFASNCGLAVHMARVHAVRRPAPSYAGRDGTCASCKRCFHTRLRLVHHLSYSSPRCLEWCSCIWSLCRTMIARSWIARMLINVAETNEKVGASYPLICPLYWKADSSCFWDNRGFFVLLYSRAASSVYWYHWYRRCLIALSLSHQGFAQIACSYNLTNQVLPVTETLELRE